MIIILKYLEFYTYYRHKPFLIDNGAKADFPADNNNTPSFKFKTKIASRIGNDGTKKLLKKYSWKQRTNKILKKFLEKSWNAFNYLWS